MALVIIAVGLHLTALSQVSRGLHISARAVTLSESERAAARVEASSYSTRGAVIGYIGFAFALASVGFVIASARRHEPARRSVIVALQVCYVMLQFLLV